jgi:putative nucleotidyltransferase with HDIG domain
MSTSLQNVVVTLSRRLGIKPYWVGGTVRDRLLGRESHDWDFVCLHAERLAKAVARKLSATFITLDDQNRIYRVVPRAVPGQPSDLTLDFAEMQGKKIEQDLARRDFSVNAMAQPLESESLIDPFQGQKDLKKKIVRALSQQAFRDDPLRLLRAFRMSAQFGLTIEPRTRRWIAGNNERLRKVAQERVREEMLRLLSQPDCGPALREMDVSGLLTVIFPDLEAGRRVAHDYYGKGGVVKHHLESVENVEWLLERLSPKELRFIPNEEIAKKIQIYVGQSVGGFPRSAYLKLGALVHDIGKPATAEVIQGRLRFFGHEDVGARMAMKLLAKLRYSRQECVLVRTWVQNHMRLGNLANVPALSEKAMARYFRDMGEDAIGMILVSLGDHYGYLAMSKRGKGNDSDERAAGRLLKAYYLKRETVLPPKLIDGHLLMKKLKLKPGPQVGELLEAVRDAQAEGKVKTVADAVAFARKLL